MKLTNRQCIEAQLALVNLVSLNLPIRVSMEVASLSMEIDKRVATFAMVRDVIIKNYKMKLSASDKMGEVIFTPTEGNELTDEQKEEAVAEFMAKVNELSETEAEDINLKIHLPDDISIKPDVIKPLLLFLVSDEGNE